MIKRLQGKEQEVTINASTLKAKRPVEHPAEGTATSRPDITSNGWHINAAMAWYVDNGIECHYHGANDSPSEIGGG